MKNSPLFSIVIPTYNTKGYIVQCVESFEKQDFNNFEIIICDDGSNDGTIELLKKLKNDYSNITVEFNEHIGAGAARNKGIELAKGEYIYFSDSDDYVSKDFFDALSKEIKNNKSDIIFFNYNEIIDEKVSNTVVRKKVNNKYDFFYTNSCIWSSLYKKSLFIENEIRFPPSVYHQDDAIFFKLIEKANEVKNINNVLYNYRKFRAGSSMNIKSEKYYNDILVVAKMNFEYFYLNGSNVGFVHIVDAYVGKLFDYALFNIAHSSIKVTKEYYIKMIDLLNKYSSDWKSNDYFSDKNVSFFTKVVRNSLKNKMIFNCYNTKLFKTIMKKKMENYQ